MNKKTTSAKPEKKSTKAAKEKPPVPENENQNKDENPFDFGGLPDRDLKKNLGCG